MLNGGLNAPIGKTPATDAERIAALLHLLEQTKLWLGKPANTPLERRLVEALEDRINEAWSWADEGVSP